MRRRVVVGVAVGLLLVVGTVGWLHLRSEGFRRAVSWRVSRPYYAYRLRHADGAARRMLLATLGEREHPVYEGLLLRWAVEAVDPGDRMAAQAALAEGYPGTWPAEAALRFEILAGHAAEDPEQMPWPLWGWGRSSFSSAAPVTANAEAWRAFLADYPTHFLADDATFCLARAEHVEGRPDAAVAALEACDERGDRNQREMCWGALRHLLLEEEAGLDAETLAAIAGSPARAADTRWVARYGLALRAQRRLSFREAADGFASLDAPPLRLAHLPATRSVPRRVEVLRRLAPLEDELAAAQGSRREAAAAIALAEAVALEDHALGDAVGLFEPWILVDRDENHLTASYLDPLLARLDRPEAGPDARLRIPYLRGWLAWRALASLSPPRQVVGEPAPWHEAMRRRFEEVIERAAESDQAHEAERAMRLRWYAPPLRPGTTS